MSPFLTSNLKRSKYSNLHNNSNVSNDQQRVFDKIEDSEHKWLFVEVHKVPNLQEEVNNCN